MILTEVNDQIADKLFIDVPREIYKHDSSWICPLDTDIRAVFDPQKNSFYTHGSCTRWILQSRDGKLIGRVAAFINDLKAYKTEEPTGGMGFFECINNYQVAELLFNTAKDWLKKRGMKAMMGPINFGENNNYWGLLIEGFTPPSYGMNYNPPYYKTFFDQYGFTVLYEQITNHLDILKPFPERFTKIAEWVSKKPGYRFEHFRIKDIEQFGSDFIEIYNDAWKDFENFIPITRSSVMESLHKMKTIMDEKLIWFAYVDDEPASFIVILPDVNQMIKSLNGKLGFIEKIKFAYRKWRGVSRMRVIVMGTKSAFQNHGLESALFIKLKEYVIPKQQYTEVELSWVGDFNDKMMAIHKATGAKFGKKHATMKKIF